MDQHVATRVPESQRAHPEPVVRLETPPHVRRQPRQRHREGGRLRLGRRRAAVAAEPARRRLDDAPRQVVDDPAAGDGAPLRPAPPDPEAGVLRG